MLLKSDPRAGVMQGKFFADVGSTDAKRYFIYLNVTYPNWDVLEAEMLNAG